MGISGVGSFPVWSEGSPIFFQLFRWRNLALNRVFSYILVAAIFFILGGVWMPPMFVCPIHLYAPCTYIHPSGVYTHPIFPPYSSVSVCSQRLCMLWGCKGLPFCEDTSLTPPLYGVPPLHWHPPHSVIASLCIGMFQGYQYVMWAFSLLLKGLGVFPISWEFWGVSGLEMSICSFLLPFL